ncbi:MAG: Protein of unknown function ElaB [Nitrosospira multiformis]|jgi:ElaB/YqjD/DUF883 family membrane-anchored ribosome-binding protein|nr:Protein of unknown function ElaB [Nitrosospira multiformis]
MVRTGRGSKEKLIKDFRSVIADTEELMKLVSNEGGGKAEMLRDKLNQNLSVAKEYLHNFEDVVMDKSRVAARATDEYVHENAWQTVGLAIAVGILVGYLISPRD